MSLTVLFDLDDTLLVNDINTFLPVYLQALGKHLAARFDPKMMIRELLAATGRMLANTDPRITLEQAFDSAFYPALGNSKEELEPELSEFYEHIFPTLAYLTQPKPQAIELVKETLARGYQVVIATNPLFPRRAIEHRLAWAGLSPADTPFTLITSYERFHFAKPHPAYFAEILAQLGWPDQPAVMVGNDPENDILPAARLGLPTFWLDDSGEPAAANPVGCTRGEIKDVLGWMERVDNEHPSFTPTSPDALAALLRATPAALDTILSGMPDYCWKIPPAPREWSITEIVCHLRDVDREVNLPRLQKVANENNPFLPGIDSDPWAVERGYAGQSGKQAFDEFTAARLDLLALLNGLDDAGWQRTARHAIFGPTRVIELAGFITIHDRTHIRQILSNLI